MSEEREGATQALREILSVLGPEPCRCKGNCRRQTYEVAEAIRIANVALGTEQEQELRRRRRPPRSRTGATDE